MALHIDDSTLNWMYGISAAVCTGLGILIRSSWTQGKAYFGPKITKAFEVHSNAVSAGAALAVEMKEQLPRVTESLSRIGETQEQQCIELKDLHDASHRHEAMHQQTGQKLEVILQHLSAKDIPCKPT